jgi:hypothetical protein
MRTQSNPHTVSLATAKTTKAGVHLARFSGFQRFSQPIGLLGIVPMARFSYTFKGRTVTHTVPDAGSSFCAHLAQLLGRPASAAEILDPAVLLNRRVFVRVGHRAGVPVILQCEPP